MVFSQEAAITMVFLCTFMWGSWFQTIKQLRGYPIAAYMLWIYGFSIIIVWGAIACLKDVMLQDSIVHQLTASKGKALLAIASGSLTAIGMQNKMFVVGRIGIILSSSISATCGILFGTFISAIVSGLPENISIWTVLFSSAVLVGATIICQLSGVMRDKDLLKHDNTQMNVKPLWKERKRIIILLVLNILFLSNAYPIGLSACVRTTENPTGFEPLLCIGLMCIGAFIGSGIYSIFILIYKKQLHMLLHPGRRVVIMAFLSAIGHYGGNVINTLASPSLSVAISWPMSNAFPIWSYSWGLLYGEYKGSKRKTYYVLALGISMCFIGLILFSISIY